MADMTSMELNAIRQIISDGADKGPQLSPQQQADLILREAARGVPPLKRTGGVTETRSYPHSANVNGHAVTTAAATVMIEGPFGPVVALYVDNISTTADAVLIGENQLGTAGVRVRSGKNRRLEFDTPTDTNGNRVSRLTFTLVSSVIDAAGKIYIEVE